MFTVFANMRINSAERLQHMKESFESFQTESDDWLINIRGTRRNEAIAFLSERLGQRATFFELLDDKRGWIANALEMLPSARHDYVFVWLEDHINIAPRGYLKKVVQDMSENKVEQLVYTWWNVGWKPENSAKQKALLRLKKTGDIEWSDIDVTTWKEVREFEEAPYAVYLVSLASIFRKDFFKKLLVRDQRKLPRALTPIIYKLISLVQKLGFKFEQRKCFDAIDRFFFYRLRLFPKETPFDLEKRPHRYDMLPLRTAFPRQELFVCIDDDSVPEPHGYSLISRGMYPFASRLIPWDGHTAIADHERTHLVLKREDTLKERYVYYGVKRTRSIPVREYIKVLSGKVRISVGDESLILSAGDGAGYFTNIPHEIMALEGSEIEKYIPKTGLAPYYFST
jgi:hypothetical protein